MALKDIIAAFTLVFHALIIMSNGTQENLSREQDLELERQLKMLNKPAVKTIKTKHGDIFDCVDIHKQPAFDHPLLKNHKLQMVPSFIPNTPKKKTPSMAEVVGIPDGGCPQGSVPIRRTKKEELRNARMFFNHRNGTAMPTANLHDVAYITYIGWSGKGKAYGTKFAANVWGLQLEKDQRSGSCTWIRNECDFIIAGWMVNPYIYGDSRTRLFSHWTSDCFHNTGCYDTLCPGFVQIDNQIPLGAVIEPLSTFNGPQYEIHVDVSKDLSSDGNWWLVVSDNKSVGYWPHELFSRLLDHANSVEWGGFVHGPVDRPSPPMGSGHFSYRKADGRSCYTKRIQLMDNYRAFHGPSRKDVYFGTDKQCYHHLGKCAHDGQGCEIYFGGPGC